MSGLKIKVITHPTGQLHALRLGPTIVVLRQVELEDLFDKIGMVIEGITDEDLTTLLRDAALDRRDEDDSS